MRGGLRGVNSGGAGAGGNVSREMVFQEVGQSSSRINEF